MSKLFDSYIVVDWSAASKPTTGTDSIWIGALTPDARLKLQFQSVNPETRSKATEMLIASLERLTKRGDRVLLGFDFPLGFPAGTAKALGLADNGLPAWQRLHKFLETELKDKPDNANNRFPLAARMNRMISGSDFPFWGCPKRDVISTLSDKKPRDHGDGDPAELRLSEARATALKLGRPQPVWKLAYAGAVGGQALTGIPVVQKLKSHFQDKLALWPMETGWFVNDDDLPQIIAAEVYPSMLANLPTKTGIKDQIQVESLAKWFADIDSNSSIRRKLMRPDGLSEAESGDILAEEGWILGI